MERDESAASPPETGDAGAPERKPDAIAEFREAPADALSLLSQTRVLGVTEGDVAAGRERSRLGRLRNLAFLLAFPAAWLLVRMLRGQTITFGPPDLNLSPEYYLPIGLVTVFILAMLVPMLGMGRSPHVTFRASEIGIALTDVKGMGMVLDEVVKTLNLFLGYRTFRERMGGTPRRAVLFEGPPGTGKTYMAKAMAAEADVPFLFVSASAFQSMYHGQTNRKIRAYFRALRKAARKEGGAIGFLEEIDAIGGARAGMGPGTGREGIVGVVNELLIQLQSFDEPTGGDRVRGWIVDVLNRLLPVGRRLRRPAPTSANILVVGATNRAADLDPALLRPGRFDRSIYFDLPTRAGRREILDYYLARKAHAPELDESDRIDALASMTMGYSPVMLEHLLDEALVWALRRGGREMTWSDVQQAKLTEELGLGQATVYTQAERRTIATHEAGHATVAYFVAGSRKLEVLSIIKRKAALGLLAHSEIEERFTKTRSEILALVQIAMGGMAAEELFFGEAGTGPAGDLQAATTAAAQMVGSLGMGGSLVSIDAAIIPGASNVVAKVLASDDGRRAVEEILDTAKKAADRLLAANRHVVEALRDALLEHDELVGREITDVIERAVRDAPVTPANQPEQTIVLD